MTSQGFGSATGTGILDAFANNASYQGPATIGIQLYVGDPGATGSANAATESTIKSVSFGAATTSGTTAIVSNDAQLQWTSVAGSEDYTHFVLWDGTTGFGTDTLIGTGTITANPVTAGDTFTIAVGDLDVTVNIAT